MNKAANGADVVGLAALVCHVVNLVVSCTVILVASGAVAVSPKVVNVGES